MPKALEDTGLLYNRPATKVPEKRQYAYALREKLVRLARRDHGAAIAFMLGVKQQWFHNEWQDLLTRHPRVLVLAPRSHGKTTQISVGRAISELGRDPNLRIKIITQADDKAKRILSEITANISENPSVKELYPNLKPAKKGTWSAHAITVQRNLISKDPSIEACGVLSTGTGGRADLLFFDDIVDFRNAIQNPALRKVVKEAYKDVWVNTLEPEGRVFYIATPWHQDDLTHELLKNPEYFTKEYAINPNFDPLWEEKWPADRLKARMREIGRRAFDRAFRNKALSEEEQTFKPEILSLNFTSSNMHPDKSWPCYTGVDLALGLKSSKSYTVIFTIARDPEGKRWVKDIQRGQFSSPDTAKRILRAWKDFSPVIIRVENNAYQQSILQWLQDLGVGEVPVEGFYTGRNKMRLDEGVPSLATEFENSRWVIPIKDHPKECTCPMCVWVDELTSYPIGDTDDTVMASWLASSALRSVSRKGGFDLW